MRLDLPVPIALVQDLLAIARLLYRSGRASGEGADRLEELMAIGNKLKTALELAQAAPGTMGQRAAWQHAEDALGRLGKLVGAEERTASLVAAVGAEFGKRASGERGASVAAGAGNEPSEREAKRRARRERS